MAYVNIDTTKPTTAQTRQAAVDSMRTNTQALRDRMVAAMSMGATFSITTGPADQPVEVLMTMAAERWKGRFSYGVSGGGSGNVISEAWFYSNNSGSTYDPVTFQGSSNYVTTYGYDANGNLISTTLGATPP